jgi:hypothetical protein
VGAGAGTGAARGDGADGDGGGVAAERAVVPPGTLPSGAGVAEPPGAGRTGASGGADPDRSDAAVDGAAPTVGGGGTTAGVVAPGTAVPGVDAASVAAGAGPPGAGATVSPADDGVAWLPDGAPAGDGAEPGAWAAGGGDFDVGSGAVVDDAGAAAVRS